MTFEPRTILITGASSGIGAALARSYAAPHTTLFLVGRNSERLLEVCRDCQQKGAEVICDVNDVLDPAGMAAFVERADAISNIDLLIANAGVATGVRFGQPREKLADATMAISTNVIGVLNTIDPVLHRMTARHRGHIAIVGSLAGLRGLPHSPAYCASKAAVSIYSQALRANLHGTGVGVSLIIPGFVRTPMNESAVFPMPLAISVEKAAAIIRRGITHRRNTIAFPKLLHLGTILLSWLPARPVDRLLRSVNADLPD